MQHEKPRNWGKIVQKFDTNPIYGVKKMLNHKKTTLNYKVISRSYFFKWKILPTFNMPPLNTVKT